MSYLRVVKFFNILTTTKMYIFHELLLSVDFCLLIIPAVTYCGLRTLKFRRNKLKKRTKENLEFIAELIKNLGKAM
jgi:hypothetical protein